MQMGLPCLKIIKIFMLWRLINKSTIYGSGEIVVAEGRWSSNDPTAMVHHIPIGPHAIRVWIDVAKKPLLSATNIPPCDFSLWWTYGHSTHIKNWKVQMTSDHSCLIILLPYGKIWAKLSCTKWNSKCSWLANSKRDVPSFIWLWFDSQKLSLERHKL